MKLVHNNDEMISEHKVGSALGAPSVVNVILNYKDFKDLFEMHPEQRQIWIEQMLMRFPPP